MDNLPSLDIKTEMSVFDPNLESAYKEAELKQNLTPLIKQELKYTILNRRHKSGQGDVVLEERKIQPKRELTQEEVKKKLRRKEQNRRAAARCRQKKKCMADQVLTDYLLEQQNAAALQQEIDKLRREKEMLERVLNEHAFTCRRAVTPTPLTPTTCYEDQQSLTAFQYDVVSPGPYPRDSVTPFQEQSDPFDDPTMQFLPEVSSSLKPPLNQMTTCTQVQSQTFPDIPLGELDLLPESLLDFTLFHQGSPELQHGGRTSISEYIDPEGIVGQ